MTNPDLRFPIGEYIKPTEVSDVYWQDCIADIEALPALLKAAVKEMTDAQLNVPYRPEGWTSRQVVHHLADSHLNMFMRLKLALTEDEPVIKPYKEDSWAELPDYTLPTDISLNLLDALHKRWAFLLKSLNDKERKRTFYHPEYHKLFSIEHITGFYAWHCRHHLAHITELKKREGWTTISR